MILFSTTNICRNPLLFFILERPLSHSFMFVHGKKPNEKKEKSEIDSRRMEESF
jgi:hypothetical protein